MDSNFKIGDYIKVSESYIDDETGEDYLGWQGKIISIDKHENVTIEWDAHILNALSDKYIKVCEELGYTPTEYTIPSESLAHSVQRDRSIDLETAKKKIQSKVETFDAPVNKALDSKARAIFHIFFILIFVFPLSAWLYSIVYDEVEFYNAVGSNFTFDMTFILICIGIFLFILLFLNGIRLKIKQLSLISKLRREGVLVKATITATRHSGGRMKRYFVKYKFREIETEQQVSSGKAQYYNIGDTIEIKYLSENPEINTMFY